MAHRKIKRDSKQKSGRRIENFQRTTYKTISYKSKVES